MKFEEALELNEEAFESGFVLKFSILIEGSPKVTGYLADIPKFNKYDLSVFKTTKNIKEALVFDTKKETIPLTKQMDKFCLGFQEKYEKETKLSFSIKTINKENYQIISEGHKSVSWNSRENKNYNKHKYHWEEGNKSFKAGRERIVSAVCNRIRASGSYIDRDTVRNYLEEVFSKKAEDRPDWVKKAAKRARDLGYNPDNTNDQKKINKENKKGYKGRVVYFSALINGTTNHFKNKGDK